MWELRDKLVVALVDYGMEVVIGQQGMLALLAGLNRGQQRELGYAP
jgi:hypothetical protein